MARKSTTAVTAENLETLGAKRLAEILVTIGEDDAVLKRELRAELAAVHDPAAVGREARKRIDTLARSRSFIEWDRTKTLVRGLRALKATIVDRVAKNDPQEAHELMWRFMALAGPTQARCDDSNGYVGAVFAEACDELGALATKASVDPANLTARCMEALFKNDYAQFDGLIPAMAPALGRQGLLDLKSRLEEAARLPSKKRPREEDREVVGWSSRGKIYRDEIEARRDDWAISSGLREIADALGDVDAYMAQFDGEHRKAPKIAADIAARLLDAGRPQEAVTLLEAATVKPGAFGSQDWEEIYLKALDAVGRAAEAQGLRWRAFELRLDAQRLKDYLSRLPDFEDVEAEERAVAYARRHPDFLQALAFLVNWQALGEAAALTLERAQDINGDYFYILSPAAERLASKHPLAATLLLRAMIDFTLKEARAKRYKHAARHLLECESLAGQIADHGQFKTHADYIAGLKAAHPRKTGFWSLAT